MTDSKLTGEGNVRHDSYDIWNAAISNGWTVAKTAEEFGVTQADVRKAMKASGETGRGKYGRAKASW